MQNAYGWKSKVAKSGNILLDIREEKQNQMKGKWKQRILAAILSIAMFFSGVAGNYIFAAETESSAAENGNSETFSGAGEGTQENPYIITNAQQMHEVRYNLSAYYVLGNDIDLSGIENWEPIGDAEEPFKGSLMEIIRQYLGCILKKRIFSGQDCLGGVMIIRLLKM